MSELETVPRRECNGTTIPGGRIVHTYTCPLHGDLTAWDILGIDPGRESGREAVDTLIEAAREEGRRAGWAEAIAALRGEGERHKGARRPSSRSWATWAGIAADHLAELAPKEEA